MSDNKNISIGSPVDIIIKVLSDRTIANKKYVAGEPYTILHNVGVNFNYSGVTKSTATEVGNLIEYLKQYPDSITIQNADLTQKIMDLLFMEGNTAQKTAFSIISSADSFITENSKNIFIYKDNERITDFTFDEVKGELKINNFNSSSQYVCFYDSGNYDYYSLETKNNAYFELDIIGKGNVEENTSDFYMSIPSCAILPSNRFVFQPGSLNKVSLYFAVLNYEDGKIIIG